MTITNNCTNKSDFQLHNKQFLAYVKAGYANGVLSSETRFICNPYAVVRSGAHDSKQEEMDTLLEI